VVLHMKPTPPATPLARPLPAHAPGSDTPGGQGSEARPAAPLLRRLGSAVLSRYATLLLLGVLVVVFSITSSRFLTAENWQNLLVTQSVVACLALAAILPLVAGEFDLSLGYLVGILAMLGAYLAKQGGGTVEVVAAMIAGGLLVGLINGVLTVYFKISSFIATLGVGIVLSGGTLGLSNGQVLFSNIPSSLTNLGKGQFLGVGTTVWLALLLAGALLYVLEHTPFGRRLYAVGGSERVAFLAGVRTGLVKIAAFAGGGLLVAVGAIFALGQSGAANPGFGADLLLPAYAAAFLGVTTYRPGYYNVPGAIVAIILLAVGFNGLNLLGAPFWVQPIFNGAVLLLAVITARAESRHVKVG
jgi:ribose transport system permease protein